ncbi:hypothetical protein SAMN05444273_101618 [Litoreibacter ascidiaceicola]|uniref:Uncharacterized protein n=1 Tax=Litoreibacter ascidiaceicola TaxID=1486859 RepID=A0A1M4U1E5_9RHOB|nr:hypothetical protein [Litoreibacter ascidiaceicola]SHE50436.1 hypothetical protein SAMN05444273_101618 [Litoreibacter ascidiaceicola]
MRSHLIFTFALCLPASAVADCSPNMTTLVSCTTGKGAKALDLCTDGASVLYRFGKVGGSPDLELVRTVRQVGYTPWPGVGSAIWEAVTLDNGAYTYEVSSAVDRTPENAQVRGGVEVFQSGQHIASVQCDAGSVVTNIDALYAMREAAGLCYDPASFAWDDCK